MPKDILETWERQEYAILAPIVEVVRGDKVDDNRLRAAIVGAINLAITSPDASYIFKKAIDMINSSDNSLMKMKMIHH